MHLINTISTAYNAYKMTKPVAEEAVFGSIQSYVEFWEMLQLHNELQGAV